LFLEDIPCKLRLQSLFFTPTAHIMFNRSIVTETVIHAPPGEIWEVLTTPEEFTASNSTFGMKEADFREGQKGQLTLSLQPGSAFTVPVKFMKVLPNRELRWFGGAPVLGGGSHYFKLEPHGDGRTKLTHGEDFNGPGFALLWPIIRRAALDRYQQTTDEIKDYCERRRMA
jgi:hypothetical protein